MRTSRKTASIAAPSPALRSASSAEAADSTRSTAGAPRAAARDPRARGSSSSTTSTFTRRGHAARTRGCDRVITRQSHLGALALGRLDRQPVAPGRRSTPGAGARCPSPIPGRAPRARAGALGDIPVAVVADTRRQRRGPGRGSSMSQRPSGWRSSMPWRTAFSTSGCSDSTGTTACRTSGVDLHSHLQALAEAGPLEVQVLLHVVQLVGERDVGALARERVAGELGELGQQLARLLGPRVDVAGDRGQRVVDEVRRDLRPQRAQLGAREPLPLLLHSLSSTWAETSWAASPTTRVSSGRSRTRGVEARRASRCGAPARSAGPPIAAEVQPAARSSRGSTRTRSSRTLLERARRAASRRAWCTAPRPSNASSCSRSASAIAPAR